MRMAAKEPLMEATKAYRPATGMWEEVFGLFVRKEGKENRKENGKNGRENCPYIQNHKHTPITKCDTHRM